MSVVTPASVAALVLKGAWSELVLLARWHSSSRRHKLAHPIFDDFPPPDWLKEHSGKHQSCTDAVPDSMGPDAGSLLSLSAVIKDWHWQWQCSGGVPDIVEAAMSDAIQKLQANLLQKGVRQSLCKMDPDHGWWK